MKRAVPVLLLGVALAVITASFVRRGCCDAHLAECATCGDVSPWFCREFGLDAATCAAIARAQEEFSVACEGHCAAVMRAREVVKTLPSDASADARAKAGSAVAEADKVCREARLAHVRRIAAMMPPAAGKRYLDLVIPRLADLDHSGAPDAAGRAR